MPTALAKNVPTGAWMLTLSRRSLALSGAVTMWTPDCPSV